MCEGDEFLALGKLGTKTYVRCRDCGYEFSVDIEPEEEDDPELGWYCLECGESDLLCECEQSEPECSEGDYR